MTTSPALFPAVTVVRDRKIRTALRTNQIAEFVTVTALKKIVLLISLFITVLTAKIPPRVSQTAHWMKHVDMFKEYGYCRSFTIFLLQSLFGTIDEVLFSCHKIAVTITLVKRLFKSTTPAKTSIYENQRGYWYT